MKKASFVSATEWNFLVVKSTSEVCTIHKNQIADKNSFYWPPYIHKAKSEDAIKKGKVPDPKQGWKKYPITKPYKKFCTYEDAVKYCDYLISSENSISSSGTDFETSNIQASTTKSFSQNQPVTKENKKKRSQIPEQMSSPSESPVREKKSRKALSIHNSLSSSEESLYKSDDSLTITPPSAFIASPPRSRSTPTTTSTIEQVIVRLFEEQSKFLNEKLTNFEKKMDKMEAKVEELISAKQVASVNNSRNDNFEAHENGAGSTSILNNTLGIPVEDKAALQKLDESLDNTNFEKKFLSHILRLGGTDVKDIVANIMDAVYCPSIASYFNYEGKKGKSAIGTRKSMKVIEAGIFKLHRTFKEADIKKYIKNWLKNKSEVLKKSLEKEIALINAAQLGAPNTGLGTTQVILVTNGDGSNLLQNDTAETTTLLAVQQQQVAAGDDTKTNETDGNDDNNDFDFEKFQNELEDENANANGGNNIIQN